ncbi:MAG: ABC-F family ATP-binding cassette domain-containing protein [Victivallaceae bacterium]|nr:ABC-F family ATP-binding cassette domain-containing protein [Victivallaceae bacterium]
MIDFASVSKFYAGDAIFDNVTFRINTGERVGIVGPNGAGKSTMFGLIAGDIQPDKGTISVPHDFRLSQLHQQLPAGEHQNRNLIDFTSDAIPEIRTIQQELETIEQRMHTGDTQDKLDSMLERHGRLQTELETLGAYHLKIDAEAALSNLGFSVDRLKEPLSSFSGGWQMRAALARVLIAKPDIMLLDEPSNYLDVPAIEWLCRFLKSFRGTLLIVSHDRFLLRKLTDVTLEVNAGKVTRYAGNYDFYRAERESRRNAMLSAKRNQDRKIDHLEKVIDRFRAKATKAAAAKSWQKALDKIEEIEVIGDLGFSGGIRFPEPPRCGVEAARLENVSFGYDPAHPVLRDVTLSLSSHEKVALIGYNGMGKSTLLKLLVGALKPDQGKVVPGHNIVIGYQAQEFGEILADEESVYDAVRGALPPGAGTGNLMNVLGSFGFSGEDEARKPVKVLSGGEKIRLCFARIFVNPPNLLVLDEPTTHLDISARELLEDAIRRYPGAVCLVSHDLEFVEHTANTIWAMENHSVKKYFGNYAYYLEKINPPKTSSSAPTASAPSAKNVSAPPSAKNTGDSKERRKERADHRNKYASIKRDAETRTRQLEEEIEQLEGRIAELTSILADPARADFAVHGKELAECQSRLDAANAEWMDAAIRLEEVMANLRLKEQALS